MKYAEWLLAVKSQKHYWHVMQEFEEVASDVRHWARKLSSKLHVLVGHLTSRQVKPGKQCRIVQVTLCTHTATVHICICELIYCTVYSTGDLDVWHLQTYGHDSGILCNLRLYNMITVITKLLHQFAQSHYICHMANIIQQSKQS